MSEKKIKGITVEIGGDATKLGTALDETAKKSKSASSELREINNSLKFDSGNIELMSQRTSVLEEAVEAAQSKLKVLGKAAEDVEKQFKNGDLKAEEYRAFKREIKTTESYLRSLEDRLRDSRAEEIKAKDATEETTESQNKFADSLKKVSEVLKTQVDPIDKVKEEIKKLGDEHPKLEKGIEASEKAAEGLAKGGLKILEGAAAATAAGIAAVTTATAALATEAVKQYGELEQNLGGSEAVFGKYAEKIQKEGEEAYRTMGTTQSEYLATANKMGALFQGSGVEQEKSLELTSKAMQRAADMASVMGIETSAALEAVTGAAKGNYTMMDNLGVKMSNTTLEAYSLEKGFDKAFSKMTDAEKAEVAMQYFFENTEQYAGNFEREATETISGSFNLISSAKDSLIAGLGNADADVVNLSENLISAISAGIDNIIPVIGNVGEAMPDMIREISSGIYQEVEKFTAMNGEMIPELITNIIDVAAEQTPMLLECGVNLIEALVTGFADNTDMILGSVQEMLDKIKDNADSDDSLQKILSATIKIISSFVGFIGDNTGLLVDGAFMMVDELMEALSDPESAAELIDGAVDIVTGLLTGIIDNAPLLTDGALELAGTLVAELLDYDWWSVAKKILNSLKTSLKNIFTNDSEDDDPEHAGGIGYVPSDGYSAILHRGESVLTAAEAATYRNSKNIDRLDAISSRLDSMERKLDRDSVIESPVNITFSGSGGAMARNLDKEVKRETRRKTAFPKRRSEQI